MNLEAGLSADPKKGEGLAGGAQRKCRRKRPGRAAVLRRTNCKPSPRGLRAPSLRGASERRPRREHWALGLHLYFVSGGAAGFYIRAWSLALAA